jgi:hypothetical protein
MGLIDDVHAFVLIADYIAVDPTGKINALGAGFAVAGAAPGTGLLAPQYVAAVIDVPSKYVGQEFSVSLELHDDDAGQTVQVRGQSGQLEGMRVQQLIRANPPNLPGVYLPESIFSRVQVTLGFPTGLPLTPSRMYSWRMQIDGQHRKNWRASFYVPGPAPQPVFGGPSGPADIPTLPPGT